MKLLGSYTNSGMIRKISDCFGMNFNPKLSPNVIRANLESKLCKILTPDRFRKCELNSGDVECRLLFEK